MNRLSGKILEIQSHEELSLVRVAVGYSLMSTIVVDRPETLPALKIDVEVKVLLKETEIVIGRLGTEGISLRNQLPSTIMEIRKGELLSRIFLRHQGATLVSIITSASVEELDLCPEMEVLAMIKTKEIILSYD